MLKFCVALGVVMAVSLVSLGWRVGIVVAAAVPLTLAFLFVIMLLTGRVFDRISLPSNHSRSRTARRRCHHRDRDDGGQIGRRIGADESRGLCLEPHRGANAGRYTPYR